MDLNYCQVSARLSTYRQRNIYTFSVIQRKRHFSHQTNKVKTYLLFSLANATRAKHSAFFPLPGTPVRMVNNNLKETKDTWMQNWTTKFICHCKLNNKPLRSFSKFWLQLLLKKHAARQQLTQYLKIMWLAVLNNWLVS